MVTLKIAWRDIIRQPLRLGLTIAAITFCALSIMATMAFSRGQHQAMIQSAVSAYSGHFQIQRKGYQEDPTLYRAFQTPEDLLAKLLEDKRVKGVAPHLETQGLASSDEATAGVMIIGVDPRYEAQATTLDNKIQPGGVFISKDNPQGVALGGVLADNLDVGVGDKIQIMTQSYYGSIAMQVYEVAGLIKTGSKDFDRSLLVMSLPELQYLMEMDGMVSHVAVVLENPRTKDAMMEEYGPVAGKMTAKPELPEGYENAMTLVPWEVVNSQIYEFVLLDDAGGVMYLSILVIVVGFIVLLTITMSVLERIKEFGVLLAIGAQPIKVFTIVMLESFLMGVLGSALGMALATPFLYYWSVNPIKIESMAETFAEFGMEPLIKTIVMPEMYLGTMAIMMTIVISVSILPAIRAARIRPVDALRYV